jgi:hypothetical protein
LTQDKKFEYIKVVKRKIVLALILFLVVDAFLLGYNFFLYREKQKFNFLSLTKPLETKKPKLEVVSKIPGYQIGLSDSQTLIKILDGVGFWSEEYKIIDLEGATLFLPQKIVFQFTPEEQVFDKVIWNEEILTSWSQKKEGQTVVFNIFVSPKVLEEIELEENKLVIQNNLLRLIVFCTLTRKKMARLTLAELDKRPALIERFKKDHFLDVQKI